jgi:hypothetical protein
MLEPGVAKGILIHVSKKHLLKYLSEFECRYNLRHAAHLIFEALLVAFAKPVLP